MRYLLITSSVFGRTWLYEEIGPSGRKRLVSTYRAEMGDEKRNFKYHFEVTRDSAAAVFRGLRDRYALGGECPPNTTSKPYRGRLCPVPRNGMSLLLWEEGLGNNHSVRGMGETIRSSILVHRGPASSLGCMAVAGGIRAYEKWLVAAERLLPTEDESLNVFVEPRPELHHTIHLSD